MEILIADDHALLRKGLIQILEDEFPDAQFGEAATTQETLDCLRRRKWSALVLDIFMPGRSGLEVLSEARREHPDIPVLVLSSAPEDQMAVRVFKAGARGYLNKQAAPEELVKAIEKVVAGGRYVSPSMAERLAAEIDQTDRPYHGKLSNREYAVMKLLVAGKSIREAAAELSLSPKTVSTFHTRIWKKLRVHNDKEMVRYAIEHGIV
jgi:DNA-binding NarL/FixJ family response regulator